MILSSVGTISSEEIELNRPNATILIDPERKIRRLQLFSYEGKRLIGESRLECVCFDDQCCFEKRNLMKTMLFNNEKRSTRREDSKEIDIDDENRSTNKRRRKMIDFFYEKIVKRQESNRIGRFKRSKSTEIEKIGRDDQCQRRKMFRREMVTRINSFA